MKSFRSTTPNGRRSELPSNNLRCRIHILRFPACCCLIMVVLLLPMVNLVSAETRDKSSSSSSSSKNAKEEGDTTHNKEPFEPITLQDSVKKTLHQDAQTAREKYWQKTLEEIRSLAVSFPQPTGTGTTATSKQSKTKPTSSPPSLNRWKIFSQQQQQLTKTTTTIMPEGEDELVPTEKKAVTPTPPARYNGFISWERLLQEWAEDIQEYLDKIEEEGKLGYPMSTFGRIKDEEEESETEPSFASSSSIPELEETTTTTENTPATGTATTSTSTSRITLFGKDNKVPRPVPAPRKVGEPVVPHTDISDKSKRIWIVTTAALPWMTGTAVNPLLRAAYMTIGRKQEGGSVTLMLPWLERREDQVAVYGEGKTFDAPEDQEAYIRAWLKNSAKMPEASEELNIRWYTAWQNKVENSIYSMGDIVATISEDEVDIMVLEEPEHLNWYRAPGESWTKKFKHVVGIVHTNYFVYAQDQPGALVRAPAMKLLCTWMCRSHCHRLIKLSGTLGQYAPEKELIENVHGVRGTFLDIGEELRQKLLSPEASADPVFAPTANPTVYFIGKMLWSKGIVSLMELLKYAEETANIILHVDMYGGGPDLKEAEAKAAKMGVDMTFHGPIDHSELAWSHKVFINPSTSEVLCTTVAEALAMGKFVVLPSHPSNDFFAQFPNCLPYASKEEFVGNLYYALTHSPGPLSEEYSYALSWKAATERFEAAGCIPLDEAENYERWVESGDAGVEITLPPLIENEKGRQLVASTLEKSRANFRKFRDSLSQDISTSRVLPKAMRTSLAKELDRRLDLDIDELLTSPKLELKLSPAELDKQCVELYESMTKGPGGDLLRIIGGGQEVALQHRYMQRQARKQLSSARSMNITAPFFVDSKSLDNTDEKEFTASQWVRWAMRRNLPTNGTMSYSNRWPPRSMEAPQSSVQISTSQKEENNLRMCALQPGPTLQWAYRSSSKTSWSGLSVPPPSRIITNARILSSRRCGKGLSLLI